MIVYAASRAVTLIEVLEWCANKQHGDSFKHSKQMKETVHSTLCTGVNLGLNKGVKKTT